MTILCHKQQLLFFNHGGWDKDKERYVSGGGQELMVLPRPNIQTVPDWVRDTETYKAAEKAGLVVEVNVASTGAKPVEHAFDVRKASSVPTGLESNAPAPQPAAPEPPAVVGEPAETPQPVVAGPAKLK